MTVRDKALVKWFREELSVSQVELTKILCVEYRRIEVGIANNKKPFFRMFEVVRLLSYWREDDPLRYLIFLRKLERDFADDINIGDVQMFVAKMNTITKQKKK